MHSVHAKKGDWVRKPVFLSVHYKVNTFRSKSLRNFSTDFNKKIGKFIQKNNRPRSSQSNSARIHRKEFTLTEIRSYSKVTAVDLLWWQVWVNRIVGHSILFWKECGNAHLEIRAWNVAGSISKHQRTEGFSTNGTGDLTNSIFLHLFFLGVWGWKSRPLACQASV